MSKVALAAMLAVLVPSAVHAQEPPLKIGFISTFSGPLGILGNELYDGFTLALNDMNNQMAGRKVELVRGDDQAQPDVGRQLAQKMVQSDKVEIITGINFSNVMLAVAKPVLDAGVFIVSVNSGPSQYAGKLCNPHFFSASFQNDNILESLGTYMQDQKIPDAYILAPNYPAGRDMLAGFKRSFKGKIDAEIYSPFGSLDYSAEIAEIRAKHPSSVVFFYPGGMGINFVKQYQQSGLKEKIPLYTGGGSIDQTSLPAVGDAALGIVVVTMWSEYLDNPASKTFAAEFEKTYNRIPSPYAAVSYDAARLIASAVKAVNGKLTDRAAFEKALETVKFDSVRGSFAFGSNHYPIQDWYLTIIGKNEKGQLASLLKGTVVKDLKDAYLGQCKMAASD